jgi:hypothetical protein
MTKPTPISPAALWDLNEYFGGALEYRGKAETRKLWLVGPNGPGIEVTIKIPGPSSFEMEKPS